MFLSGIYEVLSPIQCFCQTTLSDRIVKVQLGTGAASAKNCLQQLIQLGSGDTIMLDYNQSAFIYTWFGYKIH